MRRILAVLPLLFATLVLFAVPDDADARRLGSGRSIGKQYSVPAKRTPPPAAAPSRQQAAPAGAPQSSGASRWLGPLAGLAAGGLLASLFFGDAFEGFQVLDFLVLAALVFGGLMLFRALRGNRTAQPQPAGGPALGAGYRPDDDANAGAFRQTPGIFSGAGHAAADFEAPTWFDPDGFVQRAKVHFVRLQAAWDKGDMKDIAEYTTPQLFAELQTDRLSHGLEGNYTEVVTLNAELVGVQRDGDQVVASVRFSGIIREQQGAEAHDFAEIWHVVHAWDSPQGDWLIAGIQQV